MPICPKNCEQPHTLRVAMVLLGVKRTRLYELMNERIIEYMNTAYGRRIKHDEIDRYLKSCTVGRTPTDTCEQIRKIS